LAALPLLSVPLPGCGNSEAGPKATHDGAYPIRAVCTTGMVADLVRKVGGPQLEVTQLMGAGVDPHRYEVSSGDVSKLDRADMIFYNGLHLEGKMAELFERLAKRRPTCGVADALDRKKVLKDEEASHDPHVWFDVSLWADAALVVGDALATYDPANAAEYKKRGDEYRAELLKLHQWARDFIEKELPKERRILVTAHDAFRYFGNAYGVEVKGIQGISTTDEPPVKYIEDLVTFLSDRKVKAVFVESSVSPKHMRALIEGCRARGHEVKVGGELFSDAMGAENTPAGTYRGMVEHNVRTIVSALK
jgi:manganese/zinc/iron transport system substrate-binding protein